PHFVFNALNNIRALILEDPQKARDMLLNFSDLFRYSLKHSDQVKVELAEEIEIVNQYLELLSIQYEDKLSYEIELDDSLDKIQIPPMVLQLLVENAVKHGISQRKEGGTIKINISEKASELRIQVENSGRLKKGNKLGEKLGVGLKNISSRLELIYNGKASFQIYEEQESVIAQLNIPFI
ncbi:MAG: histidine kinase, partial [Bacteroidota bacterium]